MMVNAWWYTTRAGSKGEGTISVMQHIEEVKYLNGEIGCVVQSAMTGVYCVCQLCVALANFACFLAGFLWTGPESGFEVHAWRPV